MIVKAGVIIDLGNSETRVGVILSKKCINLTMSNKFADLKNNFVLPVEYKNEKSKVIKVNDVMYANGNIVDREYLNVAIRPSALENKTSQEVTKLSINLAIIKALETIAHETKTFVNDLDVTLNITLLLPPLEQDTRSAEMESLVRSVSSVTSIEPQSYTKDIKIDEVKIVPEGVVAYLAALFEEENNNLVDHEENKKFATGYTLVLDIGAGTTDVVLIKDTELVLNSKDTFKIGGNTVSSVVSNTLSRIYNYAPQNITQVISEGILVEGDKAYDVAEVVTLAKDFYSKSALGLIKTYLERMMISMREIKGILVVGGGSLPSIRDGEVISPAMSDILIDYLQKVAPNISLVSTRGLNPRHMNIEGLKFYHKYA